MVVSKIPLLTGLFIKNKKNDKKVEKYVRTYARAYMGYTCTYKYICYPICVFLVVFCLITRVARREREHQSLARTAMDHAGSQTDVLLLVR